MKKFRVSDSMDKLTEVFVTKENILLPFIFFINGFFIIFNGLKSLKLILPTRRPSGINCEIIHIFD